MTEQKELLSFLFFCTCAQHIPADSLSKVHRSFHLSVYFDGFCRLLQINTETRRMVNIHLIEENTCNKGHEKDTIYDKDEYCSTVTNVRKQLIVQR